MAERDTLMRAVQAARTGDQLAAAVAALDAHDRRRTASLQQSRETDMSATAVRATLEPVPAFEQHTAATDWLGDYEAPSDYRTAMIAEASRWYRGVPRDLMADPDEFQEQALGRAYTAASAYGIHALAARREFMTYVGYLTRSGASGLPQIQQTEDPKDNPAPTPLPEEVFDNFAPPQNEYNTGAESPNGQSQISSEQAPMIQQVQQMDSSGSGFGSGPEKPVEHSTAMDTSNSYAEVPLGPPGTIPTDASGNIPSGAHLEQGPSSQNPALGQNMDQGSERRPTAERQGSLSVAAYTRPDQDGFRWHIGSDQDVDTFDTPYHERCGSLHWPEQACSHGNAHTASVAVGYLMNAEDFSRRARFEAMGSAEGTAVLRTGDLKKVASHHTALTAAFSAEARTEDEIAWLHGYLARVRPVLAGSVPKGFREPEDPADQDGKKKNKGKKKGKKPWDKTGGIPPGSRLDFRLAAEAAAAGDSVPLRICPQCGSTYCKHWQGRDKPYDLPEQPYGMAKDASMRKGAPFAGYEDFDACVAANSDKDSPDRYCGYIKHQVEGMLSGHMSGVRESDRQGAGETGPSASAMRGVQAGGQIRTAHAGGQAEAYRPGGSPEQSRPGNSERVRQANVLASQAQSYREAGREVHALRDDRSDSPLGQSHLGSVGYGGQPEVAGFVQSSYGRRAGLRPEVPELPASLGVREGSNQAAHVAGVRLSAGDLAAANAELGKIKHQVEGARRTAQERPFSTEPGGYHGSSTYNDDSNEDLWQPHVRPHMRPSFRELWQIDPDAGERQPTDDDRRRFEHHVRSNYPQDVADAYFHQHQGASSLPQIQEFTDSHDNPNPGGDQLNPAVMFPLNPAFGGEGDEDEGQPGKQAARRSMSPSMSAVRMFGHLDAMDGNSPHHKDRYPFSNKAHGQYIRGYGETRGVMDGYSDRDPMDKATFHDRTGRGDLHGHYLSAFHEARTRKGGRDAAASAREDLGFSGGTQATSSLRRQADFMTKPHQSTDDANPPFNSAQTTPDEGSGDYSQGMRDGQEDAAAGEHPTFSDNSSVVSPYVKGYSVGYSGRPPDTGTPDVPRSMGGDSGQAQNAADAQRQFQVSHASLQRTAACIGCGHTPHLGQPCGELGCTDQHYEGEMGGGEGSHAIRIPEGWEKDPRSYQVKRKTMWQDHEGSLQRQAHDFTEEQRENAAHSLGPEHKLPVNSKQDLANAHRRAHQVEGIPESTVENYLSRLDKEFGKAASLRQLSAAFITREAVREPDFRKGYKYAARWTPGMLLVRQGSPAFEAGLYAAIADRPAVQEAWAGEHYRLSRKFPVLGARLDAHSGFTVKFARANPRRYAISASGYLVPVTAGTSVDLITDGPGASPDPMGSTPINGPGNPPPMGGGEDPARSGGPPPYQQAPPPGQGPVAPDDVVGQPQEPPQPSGPFTQTYSGRHPDNQSLAPVAPNTAGGAGYSNTDAQQGDPMHKPQAVAFRRRVQASLAASRAG